MPQRRPRPFPWLTSVLAIAGTLVLIGSASAQSAADPAFPVTIDHKFGSTTIESEPTRVVSVGLRDQDTLWALGVKPVAVREWWGEYPFAAWPWAQAALGDSQPVVLSSGDLDFEQIASLAPDLIIGTYSGLTQQEYDTLSRIAPTVAQSGAYANWGTPWQVEARTIGAAVGKEAEAEALIEGVEAHVAEVKAAHPEFVGHTGAVTHASGDGQFWLYGSQDARTLLMGDLGFALPDELAALVPSDAFGVSVSGERVGLLGDLDALLWFVSGEDLSVPPIGTPLYQGLAVAKEGRDMVLPFSSPVAGAFSFSTVLSLPYAVDELAPLLADVVATDE